MFCSKPLSFAGDVSNTIEWQKHTMNGENDNLIWLEASM